MAKPVLIFPAGMPRSLAYLDRALAQGQDVIGASSLGFDPAREAYPRWLQLPFVGKPGFDEALRQAMLDFGICEVFTPNPVVWDYLDRRKGVFFPGLSLVNPPPVDSEMAPYHKALKFGASVLAHPLELAACGTPKSTVSALKIASLHFHAECIPGMCDHEKIRVLCELFRYCPPGDVVEIGTWWGKSAFVLAWLAACYGAGSLLCVDPWSNEHLAQNDEGGLLDHIAIDAGEALTVFQLNLLPYSHAAVNYLRLPSTDAAVEYRRSRVVTTMEFGATTYVGRIAVLHVDGNHSYASVEADVAAWADLVMPGGWIVIDDYVWPYGDGPKRVGDQFLVANWSRVQVAFVMGSALFIQISCGHA